MPKKVGRTYQESCRSSSDCDASQMLTCSTKDGQCDCPIASYAFHCDCKAGR